jgi:hypothetical protein
VTSTPDLHLLENVLLAKYEFVRASITGLLLATTIREFDDIRLKPSTVALTKMHASLYSVPCIHKSTLEVEQ